MKRIYMAMALCFRWFMVGIFAFIIVLPTIISLATNT